MELKQKDLRIGNLFIDKYSKQIIPVLELLRNGNIVFDIECFGMWQAEPIPLTEEWLSKFGVDKWILGNRFEVRTNEAYSISIYARQNGEAIFICHLDYVHQFQNWYYFNSKYEELNIKP